VSMSKLTVTNHNRNITGLTYIYPVISRRAGGLSIGINFNPNNACNWRCIYCQVPNLKLGTAPEIDLDLLAKELRLFLDDVLHGDFYERMEVPIEQRVIKDIAIAGNGEPTSLVNFDVAISIIGDIATESGIFPESHFVLITNGSLIHRAAVQTGLKILNSFGGEVWFKMDSGKTEGRALINNSAQTNEAVLKNLTLASQCCATKIQICLVDYKQGGFSKSEHEGFLSFLTQIHAITNIQNVTIYSLARPSLQPEAIDLRPMPLEIMENFAQEIRFLDYEVTVTP
jgi:wyosine [tRNA(Phe)-imidazoG37] synthetase (radical SAM superfamily)